MGLLEPHDRYRRGNGEARLTSVLQARFQANARGVSVDGADSESLTVVVTANFGNIRLK
ncbi:hypothetical protein GCM10022276_05460 [Sphingomonas limnosediminicola]|uniref:Uncharacterized protein n=1 Tax=Sphingomonas limnosediminicola TaxID=940133 RepID=A0ABP7KZY9_9SPHN